MGKKLKQKHEDPALENYQAGCRLVAKHHLFSALWRRVWDVRKPGNLCPGDGWAVVTQNGYIHVHPSRLADPEDWATVLAHCLLHLGMGHFTKVQDSYKWNVACDYVVARFLADLKLGKYFDQLNIAYNRSALSEQDLYQEFCQSGIPAGLIELGTGGTGKPDLILASKNTGPNRLIKWQDLLGNGISNAVNSAINTAGRRIHAQNGDAADTSPQRAKAWFISSYPLLGALAASFEVIEDPLICIRNEISTAAVDAEAGEIFMNPAAGLNESESRFIMAHELMHVALGHRKRCQGRDPYLWNIACDYVINGWLVDMEVGDLPEVGVLYDPDLNGLSAEAIYDLIVTDMRRYRKLATLRGVGLGDILERGSSDWWAAGEGVELDEFYRRCLAQGLIYHSDQNRGYLPSGFIEEIKSLSQPPVPWDVKLANWFDEHFSPIEMVRTYARPSRRQSATPDIPRPSWIIPDDIVRSRTYGVVLDTSGSMDRSMLAKALGCIASYSISRQVPAVRVVFCDAAPYDQGYMSPDAIADQVKVKRRGGTVLQPAIDLLEKAEDFPKNGPILIITDGYCERLSVHREHGFLIPKGNNLPFLPRGQVFNME